MKGIRNITLLGVLALTLSAGLVAADGKPGYKGTAACRMCHQAMHKPIVEGHAKTAHPKALQKADGSIADFASNTAFTKEKVAFVLGKGRNEQAFIGASFRVLPAVWDVKAKAWKPHGSTDGSTQCIGCHVTGYDPNTKTFSEMGVGCEGCHGPGAAHADKPSKETAPDLKKLSAKQQAMVCGQCHSAGKDPSGKFAFPVNFKPGVDLSSVFVDAKPTGPGPNQQYSEMLQGKHGQMGMSCTTCHDPHGAAASAKQLKKPVNDLCLGCHAGTIKDMATHAPGAPAGATCATCHMPGGQHAFKSPGK